jgi:hypothetical protein
MEDVHKCQTKEKIQEITDKCDELLLINLPPNTCGDETLGSPLTDAMLAKMTRDLHRCEYYEPTYACD